MCCQGSWVSPKDLQGQPAVPSPNSAPRLVRNIHISAVVVSQLPKKVETRRSEADFFVVVVSLFS